MRLSGKIALLLVVMIAPATILWGQVSPEDTIAAPPERKPVGKFFHNIFIDALNSIKKDPVEDTIDHAQVLIARSEQTFKRVEGKIIRKIHVRHFGFERTFTDTANRINYIGTAILNYLHTDTREWVIRQNLFFRTNNPLNASKLADNERYLRTLEFIQDARIFAYPAGLDGDSVDIIVITKDLFSLTGSLDFNGPTHVRTRVAEANFLGMAQRIQGTVLWDRDRSPNMGYEVLYSKSNIGGSFINATVAYTQINTGRSQGVENEQAFFLRLERPLVSPFSHVAGGFEMSFNNADNVYRKPDSIFYNYRYNLYDGWIGYNLGTKKIAEGENYQLNRNRVFVSLRYMHNSFLKTPFQIGDDFDPVYNDRKALLGQVSFFRQDFYKLNYIYGFGTTEDMPTGYLVSFTGGWHKQLDLERPYFGIEAHQYLVTPKGGFVDAVFKAGGFHRNGEMEDASTLAAVDIYTKLFFIRDWRMREHIRVSYTQQKNRLTDEPLRLNNRYGLYEFNTGEIEGQMRISMFAESILYTNRKLFGFRFAPFVSGGFTLMTPENNAFRKSDIYTGIGGGVRTRNENLIFGTIELMGMFFPRTAFGVDQFTIKLTSDLQFRYRSSFVNPPDFVHPNW